jgi:hypothetical protein
MTTQEGGLIICSHTTNTGNNTLDEKAKTDDHNKPQ